MTDIILEALRLSFAPSTLAIICAASLFGLFMGAAPGLTASMAVALIVPLTYFMDPIPSLAAIITASAMAIFSGDIPAALLRMPGTPSSAAYVDDLYRMTREGKAERGLGACLIFSALGGIFGTFVLIATAPTLALFASSFSMQEYFWLACLGLSCAIVIFADSPLKGLISLLIGVFLALIGVDMISGHARYSFDNSNLAAGISFVPALIGMFALSEILKFAMEKRPEVDILPQVKSNVFKETHYLLRNYWFEGVRGSSTGMLVGVLPGAGGGIATWISYAVARRFPHRKLPDGRYDPMTGVVEAGAANNSCLSGAWIPTMVFGIPGDALTAMVIGVLLMKGIVPGPQVFEKTPELAYSIFILFLLANVLMIPFGWLAIRCANYVMSVPRGLLMSVILLFAMIGAFAINNSIFDIWVMTALGVMAFVMERNGYPVAPAILGLVLAPIVEQYLLMSLLRSRGSLIGLVDRPIAAVVASLTVLVWITPLLSFAWRHFSTRRAVARRAAP